MVQKIKILYICSVNPSKISKRLNNEGLCCVVNNKVKKIVDPKFNHPKIIGSSKIRIHQSLHIPKSRGMGPNDGE